MPTLELKEIIWGDQFLMYKDGNTMLPSYPGVDGAIVYHIIVDKDWEFNCYQPFMKGTTCQVNRRNVWAWDGNKEQPSLSPSYLMDMDEVKVHLYFIKGKIILLSDSTVVLK